MFRFSGLVIGAGIALFVVLCAVSFYSLFHLTVLEACVIGVFVGVVLSVVHFHIARTRRAFFSYFEILRQENERLRQDMSVFRDDLEHFGDILINMDMQASDLRSCVDERLTDYLDQKIHSEVNQAKSVMLDEMKSIRIFLEKLVGTQDVVTGGQAEASLQSVMPSISAKPFRPVKPDARPVAHPVAHPVAVEEGDTVIQAVDVGDDRSVDVGDDRSVDVGDDRSVDVGDELLRQRVRMALESGRIDVYLQPIVTLPQRKICHCEALVKLRDEQGKSIVPKDYAPVCEALGLMPDLDHAVLLRVAQITRRMVQRNESLMLFFNISLQTIGNSKKFSEILDFLESSEQLAKHLVFEVSQAAFDQAGPLELKNLSILRDLRFRFSLNAVQNLGFDPQILAKYGFCFVKIDATLLLDKKMESSAHIHPADMAALLERHAIGLISEGIETEREIIDLLDFDLRFGQGNIFARPRLAPRVLFDNVNDPSLGRKTG